LVSIQPRRTDRLSVCHGVYGLPTLAVYKVAKVRPNVNRTLAAMRVMYKETIHGKNAGCGL
jgi:hypothetical protein